MRLRTVIVFLLLLIPSAHFVWKNPDMPEFGRLHDDGLFFVSAKSLATGQGFRILSLPEQPAQTKYPILYPLYLSLVWRINPHFPENLPLASWASWILLPICFALTWIYWRNERWTGFRIWIVVGILAVSPYMILFGCNLFSEIFFLCWLLAALLAGQKQGIAMALLAGVLAGLAYLSRTAGIALLISMPAWYLFCKRRRDALAFLAGMLPFVAGWSLWTAAHKFPNASTTLIYYTDYVKFQFLNVGFDNLAVVLWKNTDLLLYSMGSLILPEFLGMLPFKILAQVLGIAMISGVVRMARRGIAVPYAIFALISAGMLLVWHFPPTERFVLPLFPLLAAGLVVELEQLVKLIRAALRHKDMSQRVVAAGFGLLVLAIFGGSLGLELYLTFKMMPLEASMARARLVETRATYSWIERHLPPNAAILSTDDPPLYLYTGHPGNLPPLMPRWWYAGDHDKISQFFKDVVPYCQSRGYRYILATPTDMSRWSEGQDQEAVQQALKNPLLEPLYEAPGGSTVFRIR